MLVQESHRGDLAESTIARLWDRARRAALTDETTCPRCGDAPMTSVMPASRPGSVAGFLPPRWPSGQGFRWPSCTRFTRR